jgi:tetratricopeptide (TPR) repeat protein
MLRLTAEIVDPRRGRTVLVQTADADGPDRALRAMDILLRDLRSTLGESLTQIQSTTEPLEKVSTPNLDALRAYSRSLQLAREGDFDQATRVLTHATELDPQFAAAYAFMGSVLYSQERGPEARAALEKALSIDGRLTARTRVYTRALLAHFTDPQSELDLWRMHANLYPDHATGHHNVGNVCYMLLHDYPCAETAFRKAALARNIMPNATLDTLGDVLLAEDKLDEAAEQYRAAHALSPAAGSFGLSGVLVASGKLDEAARYLDEVPRQASYTEVEREMRRVTLLVTRGQLDAAAAVITRALPEAARLHSPNPRWRAQAAMIAVCAAQRDNVQARRLAAQHLAELSLVVGKADFSFGAMEELLYAATWAARMGLATEAREALALVTTRGALDRFPVRAKLAALAQAELKMAAGRADSVAAEIQAMKDGNELWELHDVRARALRATGDVDGEMAELAWLTAHPGLAQGQWTDNWLGQQARALALRDAESRLSASGRRGRI